MEAVDRIPRRVDGPRHKGGGMGSGHGFKSVIGVSSAGHSYDQDRPAGERLDQFFNVAAQFIEGDMLLDVVCADVDDHS